MLREGNRYEDRHGDIWILRYEPFGFWWVLRKKDGQQGNWYEGQGLYQVG